MSKIDKISEKLKNSGEENLSVKMKIETAVYVKLPDSNETIKAFCPRLSVDSIEIIMPQALNSGDIFEFRFTSKELRFGSFQGRVQVIADSSPHGEGNFYTTASILEVT